MHETDAMQTGSLAHQIHDWLHDLNTVQGHEAITVNQLILKCPACSPFSSRDCVLAVASIACDVPQEGPITMLADANNVWLHLDF